MNPLFHPVARVARHWPLGMVLGIAWLLAALPLLAQWAGWSMGAVFAAVGLLLSMYVLAAVAAVVQAGAEDTLEAGRIDGASERRIFFSIIVPQILPTIVTVFVTVLIGAMKVGDLVFAFGANSYDADVIGSRFITELWTNADLGKASAIVVILLIAVIPILIYQIRTFKREEAMR